MLTLQYILHVIGDLWLPKLLKQAGQKIQVISTASDKCIRSIIYSNIHTGYIKLLYILLDHIQTSKVSIIRKLSMEYACLACALWPVEVLEK